MEQKAPGLFAALADDLTAQRTAALRALLADNVVVAFAASAHALALPVSYDGEDSAFLPFMSSARHFEPKASTTAPP